jgi:DNA-binding Xre family transcriptional regulator
MPRRQSTPPATDTLPNSAERLAAYAARAAAGEPLHVPGDLIEDPRRREHLKRLRNGHDRRDGERMVRPDDTLPQEVARPRKVLHRCNTFHPEEARPLCLALAPKVRVAVNLVALRRARKLSLGQVACATGVSVAQLSRLERGLCRWPSLAVLWVLADFYRVSLDDLVGRRPRPS